MSFPNNPERGEMPGLKQGNLARKIADVPIISPPCDIILASRPRSGRHGSELDAEK
jgi:hypothetical protein